MYYAAKNAHTWYVIGFATSAQRDAHVVAATDLDTKAILSTELRAYDARRGQISYYDADGIFFEHITDGEFLNAKRYAKPGIFTKS